MPKVNGRAEKISSPSLQLRLDHAEPRSRLRQTRTSTAKSGDVEAHVEMAESAQAGDDLLKPAELARLLGVHEETVARYRREWGMPAHPLPGGHHRYAISEVREWLKSHPVRARARRS